MRVLTLLRAELVKVFGQKGTYAGYAVLLVLVALVVWGSWRYGSPFDKSMRRDRDLLVAGKLVTGTTIARFMMEPSMFVLMPLLVCAVSGGLFAAEMQRGTMRAILCRPVRRAAVVISKYLAGWMHAISVTLFLGVVSLALGYAVFGRGELVTYYDGLTILTEPMALTRLAQGYAYCALCMCAVASLGMFLSQLVSNPLTASAVAVAGLLMGGVVGQIPYFEWLKPYLLVTHLDDFGLLFHSQVDYGPLWWPIGCVCVYMLAPFVAGLIIFHRQDITC